MELVYLWVEKYKNIKRQGFNFSPNFECLFSPVYNHKEELTDDSTILVKKSNKSLNSFFGKNINISALVGENGSGKSNILRLLYDGNFNNDYICIFNCNGTLKIHGVNLLDENKRIKHENIISNKIESSKFFTSTYVACRLHNHYKLAFYTPLFIDSFTTNEHNFSDSKFNLTPVALLYKFMNTQKVYKSLTFKNLYSIYESNMIQNYIDIYKNKIDFKLPFTSPGLIEIRINSLHSGEEFIDKYEFLSDFTMKATTFIEYLNERVIKNFFEFSFESLYSEMFLKKTDFDKFVTKLKESFTSSFTIKSIKEELNKLKKNKLDDELDVLDNFLDVCIEFIDKSSLNYFYKDLKEIPENFIQEYNKVIEICSSFLEFSWQPKLSTGQQTFLYQFSLFYKYLRNNDNLLLLIDEGETTLHPNWQKMYIKYMLEFLKKTFPNKKIHVILSTHSPFILSDIPNEHLIFLDKYRNEDKEVKNNIQPKGYCKVIDGGIKQNTFGANIHTLLSHGFFMKDGLMGEFAKDKIRSIINYHEEILEKKLTKDENKKQRDEEQEKYEKEYKTKFWQIQSIIGDDYLKQVVKNHLIEIEKILYDDYLIDIEINKLQNQIDKLNEIKNA